MRSARYSFLTKGKRRGYCSEGWTSGINLRLIDLPLFRLLPELHPFLQTIGGELALLGADQRLHVLEAALKLAVGGAQGLLGIDMEHTGNLRDDEEDIAHFIHLLLRRSSRAQLAQFLIQLLQHLLQARKLKACLRGPLLVLLSLKQRGQGQIDAIEHARGLDLLAGGDLLLAFDRLPVLHHLAGILDLDRAKDMRVTPDKLGIDVLQHIAESEMALLASNLCVQVDLEQKIAQFLSEVLQIVLLDGLGDL